MKKEEWKVLIIVILVFTIIGGFYLGRNYYIKKTEEEYVPDYLKNAGKEEDIPAKVYQVNEYSVVNIENKDMALIYLKDFYNLLLHDVPSAYQLLDESFRKEKFPTLEAFEKFAQDVVANPNSLNIMTKTVSSFQSSYLYDIITESGINYFFESEGIMVYKVRFENK